MSHTAPYEVRADEHGIGSVLIAKGPWCAECSLRLSVGDILAVRLSYSAGFREADVSFLAAFPKLRSVEIYSHEVKDLEPILGLSELEVIGLQTEARTQLCNDYFPFLRVALLQWKKGMEGLLPNETLRYLNVINFPFPDLLPLGSLSRLERLALTSRKLSSLSGLEQLRSLKRLDLYACPNLTSIDLVAQCPNIVALEVESCRHISAL